MKASDYLVEFLIRHRITDVFGYPGGMVTHLMDSFDKYRGAVQVHTNYHEQASAMAACGWAEITGRPGAAFATSGPGATNLLTGVACAYYDSIPCLFITGQVNTYEQKGERRIRQRGFQETDIAAMARPVVKMACSVATAAELARILPYAYRTALEGRPGPVLLDIPMDVFRGEIPEEDPEPLEAGRLPQCDCSQTAAQIIAELRQAKRPVILAGHGISLADVREAFADFVSCTGIPTVTSMIAVDLLPESFPNKFGMIGAYGKRWANFILNHSDCILALGTRLDCRQTGVNRELFAPNAKLLRVDIDPGELEYAVNERETGFCAPLEALLPRLREQAAAYAWNLDHWVQRCTALQRKLSGVDGEEPGNEAVGRIAEYIPHDAVVTTDVGQNQVWVAQSLKVKRGQRVIFSGGMGAMGYSLPAAIGAAIAGGKPVICFCGDGGFQMNLQELQTVARERLPIKIILFNNRSLGMIHHFQEMYFDSNYVQTIEEKGYSVPNFKKIAEAYGIRVAEYTRASDLKEVLADSLPAFMEVPLPEATYVYPKLGMRKPIHLQEPPLPEALVEELEHIALSDGLVW